jgi:hypothetical protein
MPNLLEKIRLNLHGETIGLLQQERSIMSLLIIVLGAGKQRMEFQDIN